MGTHFLLSVSNQPKALEFLDMVESKIDFSHIDGPTPSSLLHAFKYAHDSAPGPDGVRYDYWRAAGPTRCKILLRQNLAICNGSTPPKGFNYSAAAFLPKGTEAGDTRHEITREARDTQPLALKKCDNKAHAAVNNNLMTGPISAHADEKTGKASATSSR